MEYLTTVEFSNKWNISSRMVAYYCKTGRISGVIKKGKTWLIPSNATKPSSKHTHKKSILNIEKNISANNTKSVRNKIECDNVNPLYFTGNITNNFGITRDTLRYYEKIGLISPKRKLESTFRIFDANEIFILMLIDFYRKRGFDCLEIKGFIAESNYCNSSILMGEKILKLEQNIYNQQMMLERLKETKKFYDNYNDLIDSFEIREMPLFSVTKIFDDSLDIYNYQGFYELHGEDLLSSLVRTVTFDNSGYTGSKMLILRKEEHKNTDKLFLNVGKCLYILASESGDADFLEELLIKIINIGKKYNIGFKNISYAFIKYGTIENNITKKIYEIWVPIK